MFDKSPNKPRFGYGKKIKDVRIRQEFELTCPIEVSKGDGTSHARLFDDKKDDQPTKQYKPVKYDPKTWVKPVKVTK